MQTLVIHVDGASRGNPGAAGIGVVLADEKGAVLREISEYIGETTNNVAEYTALVRGLTEASDLGATGVRVFTDSELLARQICGQYKVKAAHLKQLNETACSLMGMFRESSITHVPREQNADADRLASKAAQQRKSQCRSMESAAKPAEAKDPDQQPGLFADNDYLP